MPSQDMAPISLCPTGRVLAHCSFVQPHVSAISLLPVRVTLGKRQVFLRTPSIAYKRKIFVQQTSNEVRKRRLNAVV